MDRESLEAALRSELSGEGSARSERTAGSKVSHAIDLPSVNAASGQPAEADVEFRPKSKARIVVPLVLLAAALGTGAFFFLKHDEPTAAAPPPPTATATTTTAPQPTETAVAIPAIVKPPTTTAEEAPPPPQPSASEKEKSKTVIKTNAKLPPPVKPNCDVPYTVDAQGHKHFRTECL
jgi:serine/threonine-protein kinase